jgi:hypothetical protein
MNCESCKTELERGYQSNDNLSLCQDCADYKAQDEWERYCLNRVAPLSDD